eukprot:scaffold237485_cov24-Tisochrysis_lutea.AAC.7
MAEERAEVAVASQSVFSLVYGSINRHSSRFALGLAPPPPVGRCAAGWLRRGAGRSLASMG